MSFAQAALDRKGRGFFSGAIIGSLGGLIGLGGAEFRLPLLVGYFRLPTLEAVIFNKAMSMVVVAFALLFRAGSIPFSDTLAHLEIVVNLLAGSLLGAWWAAGYAMQMSRRWLDRTVLVLLLGLAVLMLSEHWLGFGNSAAPLFENRFLQVGSGLVAGLGIGGVAALLGVAGGELLIPTLVLLFGVDIKLAGSLSLAVSLPTMMIGFIRYRRSGAFAILGKERTLFVWMALGSITGAALGSMFLGVVSSDLLVGLLGLILLISAIKVFRHAD